MREDVIFVIVTVGVRSNTYALRKLAYGWKETKLKQNQYAYKLTIRTDAEEWKERIEEVKLDQVHPPEKTSLISKGFIVDKDTPTKVLDRMSQ